MNLNYIFHRLFVLAFLALCIGCTEENYQVDNTLGIEVRSFAAIDNKIATTELSTMLKGIEYANNAFRVPEITIKDIYKTDSLNTIKPIRVPINTLDNWGLALTDNILDKSTYEDNYDDYIKELQGKDNFKNAIKLLSTDKQGTPNEKLIPSSPPKENEFFIGSLLSQDSAKHQFATTAELATYLMQSTKNYDHLIVYFMGGKTVLSFVDSDKDGFTDDNDKCPTKPSNGCEGCPCPSNDPDGDGVPNDKDACKDVWGQKENNGCPLPDKDKDGTPDKYDKCPNVYGKCNGCACPSNDLDGDGIPNASDNCPDQPGPKANSGCPVVPEINHNNSNGTFNFTNVDKKSHKIKITITDINGVKRTVEPKSTTVFPKDKSEYNQLAIGTNSGAGLNITIEIYDNFKNNLISIKEYNDIDAVCFVTGECGFIKEK
jgi:hypothetical protein